MVLWMAALIVGIISCSSGQGTAANTDTLDPLVLKVSKGTEGILTVHDHALLVKAAVEYGDSIDARLAGKSNPTFWEILEALVQIKSVPDSIKERAQIALAHKEEVENLPEPQVPDRFKPAIEEIMATLQQAKDGEEAIALLESLKVHGNFLKDPNLTEKDKQTIISTIDFDIQILQDGASTIYSPEWWEERRDPTIKTNRTGGSSGDTLHPPDSSDSSRSDIGRTTTIITADIGAATVERLVIAIGGLGSGPIGVGVSAGSATVSTIVASCKAAKEYDENFRNNNSQGG